MSPRRPWSDAELAALRSIAAGDRAAMRAFRVRFPGHSSYAIAAKLSVLRGRGEAPDVTHRAAPDLRLRPRPPAAAAFGLPKPASPEKLLAVTFASIGRDFGGPTPAG
jgi:hypothetical protein